MAHGISERDYLQAFRAALRGGCSALVLAGSSGVVWAQAASTNWTDGTGNWFSSQNWDNGVPGSNINVSVANGGTAQVGNDGAAAADTLTVGQGSGVSIASGSSLTVVNLGGTGLISFDGGILKANSSAEINSYNAIEVGVAGGTIDSNGAHPLILYGTISNGSTPGTLAFTSTQGRFSDVPNVVLYGSNTFSGGAVVEGNLQVMIGADNALGSGSLEVDAGGAASFAGTTNQSVTTLTGTGAIFATGYGDTSPTLNTLTVASGDFAGRLLNGSKSQPVHRGGQHGCACPDQSRGRHADSDRNRQQLFWRHADRGWHDCGRQRVRARHGHRCAQRWSAVAGRRWKRRSDSGQCDHDRIGWRDG